MDKLITKIRTQGYLSEYDIIEFNRQFFMETGYSLDFGQLFGGWHFEDPEMISQRQALAHFLSRMLGGEERAHAQV